MTRYRCRLVQKFPALKKSAVAGSYIHYLGYYNSFSFNVVLLTWLTAFHRHRSQVWVAHVRRGTAAVKAHFRIRILLQWALLERVPHLQVLPIIHPLIN